MKNKFLLTMIGGALVLSLVAGAAAFLAIRNAQAQEDLVSRELRAAFEPLGLDEDGLPGVAHGRPGRLPGNALPADRQADDTYLAEALGISAEELQAARQAAWEKGIQQLVDSGEITQAQADRLKELGMGKWGFAARIGGWMMPDASLDYDALLAAELGISVDDLQAAREKAKDLALQAAIDSGKITQEQADLIKARAALMPYLDRQTLTAKVLGMSVEELKAALEGGSTIQELMTAEGLNAIDFQKAMLDAYQAAIDQAVQDGVITQAQADEFLNRGLLGGFGRPGKPGMDGRKPGRFNDFPAGPEFEAPGSDL